MQDKEPNQAVALSLGIERFFHSARSAVADHVAGLDQQIEASFRGLQVELEQARDQIGQHDRKDPDRFNVFSYIEPNENRLSNILSDLLDPKGTHGQNDAFLRLLAELLRVTIPTELRRAKIYREETTAYLFNQPRRIDILVDFGTFGIGIENKPWAGEQVDQVQDYLLHLRRQYNDNFLLLYLSGSGEPPTSVESAERNRLEGQNQFRLLDYRGELVAWLGRCIEVCKAEHVRWFLQDFRSYVLEHFRVSVPGERG